MKLILSFIAILLFGNLQDAAAQRKFEEGTLVYSIEISSPNPSPALAKSLKNATLTLSLKGDKSRAEMNSALGKEVNVYSSKAGKGFILKEYSGQKLMITANKDNWVQKNKKNGDIKFSIGDDITNIEGIKCKKATGALGDGKTIVVYFDPSTQIVNEDYNNAFPQLPGMPVQYEVNSGNLTFRYTLKSINSNQVSAVLFDAPTSGYRIMTFEENQQLKIGED